MCGILGIISPDLPPTTAIREALNSIQHRGPDDEGYVFLDTSDGNCIQAIGAESCSGLQGNYAHVKDVDITRSDVLLGHRRLAIIDVSSKGHQPMSFDNGNLWITYNGEIFNYKELKSELQDSGYHFSSGTDTEVILAAYSKWGENCVNRFNGQWAFCIYDKRKKRMFCSRDRFGIKPFYYWFDGTHFAFASEIKALLRIPFVKREINRELMFELIVFHMMHHSEESMYKGIYQLLPSHNLTVDLNGPGISLRRYYELPYNNELGRYDEGRAFKYADDIRDLLVDAVKVRLISDVPVGSCLSGGLDSSSIVVIINKLLKEGAVDENAIGQKQKTFTASFDEPSIDEKIYADEVIRHTGVESFFVYPTAERLWKELDNFLFYHDGLCKNTNVYAGWEVMRLASRHVKVVLNGQGSDELFGGYPQYEPVYLADIMRKMRLKDLCLFLSGESKRYGLKRSFSDSVMGGYLAFIPDSLKRFLFKERNRKQFRYIEHLLGELHCDENGLKKMTDRMRSLNYLLYCDIAKDYLRELLKDDDRNASAFSIENRVPFVDHRLVEYVSGIPSIYKIYHGWSKWLLRLAMRDLLPEKILWRKDKIGFATPIENWMRHKDSPIPFVMSEYGLQGNIPYFLWKFYLVQRLLARHEQDVSA
jgi:asparagine synthase (glutamine-hydrolysing)